MDPIRPHPFACEVTLPVLGAGQSEIPIIFYSSDDGESALIAWDAVFWARELQVAYSFGSIHQRIKTLCRFMNFIALLLGGAPSGVDEQTNAIYAYLDFRINGTRSLSLEHPLRPLDWQPISKTTARNEFAHIIQYFKFVERSSGGSSRAINHALFRIQQRGLDKLLSTHRSSTDFLIHLHRSREFWRNRVSTDFFQTPAWARPKNQKNVFRPYPEEAEINEIIAHERNPVFKSIWLLAAYGGSHRISEILNIWQSDILPSSYRKEFFGLPVDDRAPLVLMAHPAESTYLGHFRSGASVTRQAHLRSEYRLRPRNLIASNDGLYAGWKSKRMYGAYGTADTFWLNSTAASLFSECVREVQRFHLAHKTSRYHPYFFVNMFSQNETLGAPLRMKRVQSAWKAACLRVGIEPHRRGRNIHGLRHFAKECAKAMGLSGDEIQIVRGDQSISSQDDYGRCAAAVHRALRTHTPNSPNEAS